MNIDRELVVRLFNEALCNSFSNIWREDDAKFLKELALDLAAQKIAAVTGPEEDRERHEKNVEHLVSIAISTACLRGLEVQAQARAQIIKLLMTLLDIVLKAIIAAAVAALASANNVKPKVETA